MNKEAWDIHLDDVTVGYGDNVVLRDVSADMPAGKVSVILGGSGCGKSTLMRHILGLQKPMAGTISLGGQNLFELNRSRFRCLRRRMGVLFQDGALLGSMTLGENMALPLKEHTTLEKDVIDRVVHLKLGMVGLDDFADYFPSQLSGGMRKRAGLARAIVMDPPILLCDEPTSGLDPINAAQMDQLLLDMNRLLDVTVVTVSHDLQSLYKIADYVIVLHEGRAIFTGDLDELKSSRDPYLRQFLDREPGEHHRPDDSMHEAIIDAMEECPTTD